MTNSLILFLIALVFLAFGYVSVVRTSYNHYFSNNNGPQSEAFTYLNNLVYYIGQGAIFTCLAATSLLLFWGWGVALLWLLAFHLLAETTCNFQSSTVHLQSEQPPEQRSAFIVMMMESVWSVYVLLLSTIVVALLVSLINQQTGLVFALIALFPAHLLLRNAETGSITRFGIVISLTALLLGMVFSHKLGISIYGGFNPVESLGFPELANGLFSWLRFDNTSIITVALIISGLVLSDQAKFRSDLSHFCGFLVLLILAFLIIKLVWMRPILDAPLNSLQTREPGLPSFGGLSLFLFAGLTVLLLRDKKDSEQKTLYKKITDGLDGNDDPAPTNFVNLQLSSFTMLMFSLILLLILACALGIGAWNTHYLDWSNSSNLAGHFNLAVDSLLSLLNIEASSGEISYSVFIAGLAFAGFALLLNILPRLTGAMNSTKEQSNSVIRQLQQTKVLPAMLIYLISNYLVQNGISIDLWILVGMLAWCLVTDRMIVNSLAYRHLNISNGRSQSVQSIISLIFVVFGLFQVILTTAQWLGDDKFGFAAVAAIIVLVALLAWKNQIVLLLRSQQNANSPDLFS